MFINLILTVLQAWENCGLLQKHFIYTVDRENYYFRPGE